MITVLPVWSAVIGTASHRNHILGFGHLFIKTFDPRRHLQRDGAGHYHHIRLTGRSTESPGTEAIKIVARSAGRHHFNGAARQPERHGPERRRAGPIEKP